MIVVQEAKTKQELRAFIHFQPRLYKGCKNYVPPLAADEKYMLDREKNPSFAFCKAKYFLCYKHGVLAGRICCLINYEDEKKTGLKRLRFCRFDFIEDFDVCRALFEAAENFGREEGREIIHGPIGFNDTDREGLLVEGFEYPGTFATQYSFPYYHYFLERLHYVKDVDWIESRYEVPPVPDLRMERIAQKVLRRYNMKVAAFSKRQLFRDYGRKLFDTLDKSYSVLYGTIPLQEEVVDNILANFKFVVRKELVCLVTDADDNVAAVGVAMPAIGEAVRKSGGRLLPFGLFRILKAVWFPKEVELMLLGVLPQHQNKGLNAVVLDQVVRSIIDMKIRYVESNAQLEDNNPIIWTFQTFNGRQHKRRRVYKKQL